MSKTLTDLLQMQHTQLSRVTKNEFVEIIRTAQQDDNHNQIILTRLTSLMAEVAELKQALMSPDSPLNKKVEDLQLQVNKQADVIAKQQRYMEYLDRKERECNLVLLGIPDDHEALDGATTDREKVDKVWQATRATSRVTSVRRLGKTDDTRQEGWRRPILVTVTSRDDRDAVLAVAKHLKTATEPYRKVYIKKDVHPSVRQEWQRLRAAEKSERERPENIACNIHLNVRERQLYKDGIVIDKWNCLNF